MKWTVKVDGTFETETRKIIVNNDQHGELNYAVWACDKEDLHCDLLMRNYHAEFAIENATAIAAAVELAERLDRNVDRAIRQQVHWQLNK